MYGGYGNAWNQASSWPTGTGSVPGQTNQIPHQNQQSVFTTNTTQHAYQQQHQQNYAAYAGGNVATNMTATPATPAMMGYMNYGMAANNVNNPYMNYGGTAAAPAYNVNANHSVTPQTQAATNAWLTNQRFQLQQAFPGGQPPLPPGPPPPDKPKEAPKLGLFAVQPPLPPANQNKPNAPPPPPPPPAQANPLNSFKPEDAYNIIKSAAALGMLPSSGPLAPLTALNVSEELFGSKGSNSGIPGLDMTEDDKVDPNKSPDPELIDLEKEASATQNKEDKKDVKNADGPSNSNAGNKNDEAKTPAPKTDNFAEKSDNKKEVVWELRSQNQGQQWNTAKKDDVSWQSGTGTAKGKDSNVENNFSRGWNVNPSPTPVTEQAKPVSTAPGNNPGLPSRNNSFQFSSSSQIDNGNTNSNANTQQGPPVRIPLEAADGKELVYDKKTLRQFDQKFREWENDFERWKSANENHPDQAMYRQYLSQWNLWREQLVEQRRSILDTMTKARLDSTEIFASKLKAEAETAFNTDEFDNFSGAKSFENPSKEQPNFQGMSNNSGMGPGRSQQEMMQSPFGQRNSENLFGQGMQGTSTPEPVKRTPLAAPNLSHFSGPGDVKANQAGAVPLLSLNLSDQRPPSDPKNQRNERGDRPVERILRDGGGGKGLDNKFEAEKRDANTFGSKQFLESSDKEKDKDGTSSLPFEWTLPSQSNQEKNPFNMRRNENPFMHQSQPSGPNPFDVKPEEKLPSLDDFIKKTNLDFTTPKSLSTHDQRGQGQSSSNNPFIWSVSTASSTTTTNSTSTKQVERIPRDPMGNSMVDPPQVSPKPQPTQPVKTIRLEANPVGMPLLISTKEPSPPPKSEFDEISHLFSRDRHHAGDDNEDSNRQVGNDDFDFGEDTEVIDFGAGAVEPAAGDENSNDSMDFPRGENPDKKDEVEDDLLLEDSEVIDYSQGIPPEELEKYRRPATETEYGAEEYAYGPEHGYPPDYFPPAFLRGRGRGRGFPPWARGHPRGFPPGHPFFGRMPGPRGPFYPPEFGPGPLPFRGRPYGRGMFMGRGLPPPGFGPHPHPAEWYQHDEREYPQPVAEPQPEVVELSPSPSPESQPPLPHVKIAPPNPDFERDRRRSRSRSRSRSRDRSSRGRDRSRSRSRDRVSRRGRDRSPTDRDRDRRRDDTSRRDSDRTRDRRSPDRRSRHDDRGRDRVERDRDRFSRRRSKSRSKSPFGDRERNVSLVRNPLFPSASVGMLGSHPAASNPPAPRYQTLLIEDILNKPGRSKRPPRIVIFMRGLPGSGKSHIVKLIKEREVEMGGKAPRILSLDNYFTTEIEKKEKDPVTGQEEKKTVMEYEFDEEREPLYRAQLVRQFKKTLDEGYFSFVIVDCVNEYVRQFEEMAQFATLKRFQVYVAEIEETVDVCFKRNIHKRTRDDIMKINRVWEKTPSQFIKVDTRTLLQDEAIQDVEMEDVSDVEADTEKVPAQADKGKIEQVDLELEDIEDEDSSDNLLVSAGASKWDTLEQSQEKLNKLDGLMKRKRSSNEDANVDSEPSIENWLRSNMPEDYIIRRPTVPGQKRVRWADIEERREQERMREVGFVVGHTDWNRMMDPTFGSSALTRTKFI